jgi:hypothetical protein
MEIPTNSFFNMSGLPDMVTNPDGSVTIGGTTYKDGKVVGPFNLETPPDGVTQAQLDAITNNNGVLDPQDPAFAGLSTVELLTLGQTLGAPTTGSTLEIDSNELETINRDTADFNAPAMYTDPNTGELLSEEDYFALYPPGPITSPNVTINDDGTRVNTDPETGVKYYFAADGSPTGVMDADGNFTSYVDNNDPPPPGNDPPPPPGNDPPPATVTTMDDIANFLTEGGLGSTANFFREGSATADQVRDYLSGDRLDEFNALMAGFDPSTYTYEGNYSYNPYNPDFGTGTGRETVYAYNPLTGEATMMNAGEAATLGYETFNSPQEMLAAYPQLNAPQETNTTDTVENVDDFNNLASNFDFNTAFTNYLNERFPQQNTNNTGLTGIGGLLGLLGGYGRGYGNMYGGSYMNPSYSNPFFGGYGYGYGMNPYAGGIGSFYGNMGSGYSPSMYGSPFFGGYGGFNYNQLPYNPYSTLYNQYSSPGFSGDMYTTDYQTYLDTPFEGQKYSQDYQDYLSTNNPSMYNNLFGTA